MVIEQVHVCDLTIHKAEDNAPVPRDAHTPVAATVACQPVEPLEQITMLCSASLSSLRSAGFQPAWRPGWPPSQAGRPPHPLPGRLVPALVFPDERGLARLHLIGKRSSRAYPGPSVLLPRPGPTGRAESAEPSPWGGGVRPPLEQCPQTLVFDVDPSTVTYHVPCDNPHLRNVDRAKQGAMGAEV